MIHAFERGHLKISKCTLNPIHLETCKRGLVQWIHSKVRKNVCTPEDKKFSRLKHFT